MFNLKKKDASKKVVNVYMDKAGMITDLEQLLTQKLENIQITKAVTGDCPWNKNLKTIDFKLDVFGTMEDHYYSRVPSLIQNVRRGNSLVQIKDESGNISYHMGRKGLMKFFDMRLSYISELERDELKDNDDERQVEKNYIMAPVLRAIREGHSVEVFKTLKANGENV